MIDESTRKRLDSHDWESIANTLSDYTLVKVNKAFWRSGRTDLPKGNQIEDIVVEAVANVYSGRRKWNPQEDPDLVEYLRGVIDSIVSHLLNSYDHRHQEYFAAEPDLESTQAPVGHDVIDCTQNPLSEAIANEQWKCLWESSDGDEDIQLVLLCSEERVIDRSDMAQKLQWDLKKVDRVMRRIRRHMKKCINQR